MSHEAVTWAMYEAPSLRTDAGRKDSTARQVLSVFAEKAYPDGTNSFPSAETIAEATDLEVRTVERAIRRLEDAKLIERTGKRRGGVVVWRLNMSLTRSPSDQDEVRLKQEARRQATAERVRRHREGKAAEDAATARAEEPPDAPVTHSDGVTSDSFEGGETQSECVTNGSDGDCVTHSDCVRNALRLRSVTHSTPCEPPIGTVLDPPSGGTLPPDPLRPQPLRSSGVGTEHLSATSVGGSSTTRSDLESPVPHAHERASAHPHEARRSPLDRCQHGQSAATYPDGLPRCVRCRRGVGAPLQVVWSA